MFKNTDINTPYLSYRNFQGFRKQKKRKKLPDHDKG